VSASSIILGPSLEEQVDAADWTTLSDEACGCCRGDGLVSRLRVEREFRVVGKGGDNFLLAAKTAGRKQRDTGCLH